MTLDIQHLAQQVRNVQTGTKRVLVAIVGAPSSGKSTLSENLQDALGGEACGCAIVPMDGFHFDDEILEEHGLLERKGAPNTFDVGGLKRALIALREDGDEDVYVPVFDRNLEISRGSARAISRDHRIILVEGNYLLLNQAPWDQLKGLFDLSIHLEVAEEILRDRLIERWVNHGYDAKVALSKAMKNDLPNAQIVSRETGGANIRVRTL